MAAAAPQPPLPYKPISTLFSTKPHHHSLLPLPLPSKRLSLRLLSLSSASPLPLASKTRPFLPSLIARTSGWAQQEVQEEVTASAGEDFNWDEQEPSPAAAAEEEEEEEGVEAGLLEWEGVEGAAGESGVEGAAGDSGVEGEFAAGEEEEFPEPPEEAKLFVGNLPYDVDSQGLAELFEKAGVVEIAEVIYNRETDQSRGFGFITMCTVEEAEKAVEMFHRYDINGRLLTVNKAAPRGARIERTPRVYEPSFRIYVGNIPWQVDDARLEQVFSEHGKVVDARVVYDRESGRSRGFGFVTMASQTELDDAIAALDGQSLDGRPIRVNVAEDRPRRGGF